MIAQIDKNYIKIKPTKLLSRLLSYSLFEGRPLTTRGQWVNPLVFALFSILKRLPQLKNVNKPIFIIGTGRSGTTILGILLSIHSDIGFLNEPKALWHAIYDSEDLIGSYSTKEAYYRLDESHASEEVKRNAHRLFGAYLTAVLSPRLVDKYPELIFRVPFVKSIFPDAKFLFLVRNGWDTCNSIMLWSQRLGSNVGQECHDWWGLDKRKWHLLVEQIIRPDQYYHDAIDSINEFHDHINMAVVEWIATMREGLKMMQLYPDDILMVRFEDMTSNAVGCFQEILEFCELPEDKTLLRYAQQSLTPLKSYSKAELHRDVIPLFRSVMSQLGYYY